VDKTTTMELKTAIDRFQNECAKVITEVKNYEFKNLDSDEHIFNFKNGECEDYTIQLKDTMIYSHSCPTGTTTFNTVNDMIAFANGDFSRGKRKSNPKHWSY